MAWSPGQREDSRVLLFLHLLYFNLLFIFISFYRLERERGKERERNIDSFFYPFMTSMVSFLRVP